ncbi:MAG: TIGR00341 family protein [Thermostichus sp. BF3_bins_97]
MALLKDWIPDSKRRRWLRTWVGWRRRVRRYWWSNSGDWRWLGEKPIPVASLNRLIWRDSVPSLSFLVMLSLSGIISTLGLLAGSTAVVIGAMIIAPLMGPILGIAYAAAVANRRLLKRAALTLLIGSLITVLSAILICQFAGLRDLNDEIRMRTQPTLLELGVALGAGAAGAFAKSRKSVADALPGVAIAVALIPPLSVIGIGLALSDGETLGGSFLLFITNLAGIIFSGMLTFLWQQYGSLERAQGGIAFVGVVTALIGIPLGFSLRNLLLQSNTRQQVRELLENQLDPFERAHLRALRVRQRRNGLEVDIEISAPPQQLSEADLQTVHRFLENTLEQPVLLQVSLIPVQQFQLFPDSEGQL